MKNNDNIKKIDKSKFEFVQKDDKIYDKKFETKPIGYFKDAMIRFTKNKSNVVASLILLTLILLSIFVPLLTTKNFVDLEIQVANLPPRIPLLEKIGIADGTSYIENQAIDRATIDPITGLGIPEDYNLDFIVEGTLENIVTLSNDVSELVYGGMISVTIDANETSTVFSSLATDRFLFSPSLNPELVIDVEELEGDSSTKVDVYIVVNDTPYLVETINQSGVYSFNPLTEAGLTSTASAIVQLELSSNDADAKLLLNSVELYDDSQIEPVKNFFGYDLYLFDIDGNGTKAREDGELIIANFRYNVYDEVFSERESLNYNQEDFNNLILGYSDQSKMPSDLTDYEALKDFTFPTGSPIKDVIDYNVRNILGNEVVTFHVVFDYAALMGYDGIPYFLFGTTQAGHDMFALSWFGLRTSLMIGLIAAAINVTFGIIYGAIAGYYGGKVDILMERFAEVIGRIPWLVTLSIFISIFGPGALTLILILVVSGWIGIASVTRTQFYRYKGREYVLASRTLGAKDSRLIFRHILPNGIGTIITASVLMIPYVIFTEAALSYLGYGIGHSQSFSILGIELSGVSIGVLLSDGRTQMVDRPYLTLFPAIIISILMITFNMFGNALRDAFNPSLRGSE
jgi:ABC-type dipeptide/oligopeptide/nickel transport system permease subunit